MRKIEAKKAEKEKKKKGTGDNCGSVSLFFVKANEVYRHFLWRKMIKLTNTLVEVKILRESGGTSTSISNPEVEATILTRISSTSVIS